MGILHGLLGNASEVDIDQVEKELLPLLAASEDVEKAFRLIRDLFIFTNKRLILIDKQGLSGKKTEYHSIPYRSIAHFSVESAGHFDLDSELKIWVKGMNGPIVKTFRNSSNIVAIQQSLATYIFTVAE